MADITLEKWQQPRSPRLDSATTVPHLSDPQMAQSSINAQWPGRNFAL